MHQAKAPSAGSTEATGNSRASSRRALAIRVARNGSKGTGAPAPRRLRITLAVLALAIAAFAVTAASASAAPLAANMETISGISYTSAQVTGKVSSPGGHIFALTPTYSFEYSTDEINWTPGPGGSLGDAPLADKPVNGKLEGLKGGTHYFVRLRASTVGEAETVASPEAAPYPSFTTLTVDPATVLLTDASEVKYTTAKASGEIQRPANSNPAFDVNCRFEYVTDDKFDATGYAEAAPPVPCGIDSLTAPNAKKHVEVLLEGLAPATEYHLRLTAFNAGPDASLEAASTFTTLTVGPPSVVSIDNAGEVEYTQAQVKGVVERPNTSPDPAFDVTCNFEYITDDQYKENEEVLSEPGFTGATPVVCEPEAEPAENPITATGQRPVKAALGGLSASTTYHLRLSASNQGGSDAKEAPATFTTEGPAPAPSVLTIADASEVKAVSAQVSGSVERPAGADPGLNVNCRFEYVTQAQFEVDGFAAAEPNGQVVGCEPENPITSPAVTVPVKAKLNLAPETTYHLRLAASNVGGTATKEAATFTTEVLIALDPPIVGYTSAEVSATINTNNCNDLIQFWFQYSTEPDNPDSWTFSNLSGDNSGYPPCQAGTPISVGGTIKELQPETTYSIRLLVNYFGPGSFLSPEPNPSITTKPVAAPTATLDPVTNITANSAHFSGTVSANAPGGLDGLGEAAYETKWHIECVPACNRILPAGSGSGVVKAGEGTKAISVDATELDANTSYEVKLVATSVGGASADAGGKIGRAHV